MEIIDKYSINDLILIRGLYSGRSEWREKDPKTYQYAKNNNLLDEITLMISDVKPTGYWNNYQHCLNSILECETYTEWCKNYPTVKKASKRN